MAEPRKIRQTEEDELALLQTYEEAYNGYQGEKQTPEYSPHHPLKVLSQAEVNDVMWSRLWKPRNFLAKIIEEPVGYLGQARPRLNPAEVKEDGTRRDLDPDDESDAQLQATLYDIYERIIRPRQADLVLWQGLFGKSFAKVTYDPGAWKHKDANGEIVEFEADPALHVVAYPRLEAATERANAWHDSEDPDRVTSAVVYWFERDEERWDEPVEVKHAQLLYPDRIEWLRHDGQTWSLDEERGGVIPHDWGVVPLAVCWNNGKPDVHDGLDLQATLNKDIYDQNAGAQNVAFPQRYRKGLIPPGGWNRNPLTGQREVVEPMRSGPHILWDVPEGGDVGQLPADTGTYLKDKYASDIEDLATLCRSVAVAKMKLGSNTSGESKHMDSAQLLKPRIQAKAEGLGACIRDIYRIIFAMAKADSEVAELLGLDTNVELDVEAVFEVDFDRDALAEAQLDMQDRMNGNMSLYSYLLRRGFTESEAKKEAERLKAEREEAMAEMEEQQARMDPYAAGGDEDGGSAPPRENEPTAGGQTDAETS